MSVYYWNNVKKNFSNWIKFYIGLAIAIKLKKKEMYYKR